MKALFMIGEKGLLNDSGVVIAEHFFKRKLPELAGELEMIKGYRYGDTMLTIYKKKKETEKIGGSGEKNCHLSWNL